MILVDSSVWIEYFNKQVSKPTIELDRLLSVEAQNIYVADLIILEILRGIRDDNIYEKIKHDLFSLQILTQHPLNFYFEASQMYRLLRKKL